MEQSMLTVDGVLIGAGMLSVTFLTSSTSPFANTWNARVGSLSLLVPTILLTVSVVFLIFSISAREQTMAVWSTSSELARAAERMAKNEKEESAETKETNESVVRFIRESLKVGNRLLKKSRELDTYAGWLLAGGAISFLVSLAIIAAGFYSA